MRLSALLCATGLLALSTASVLAAPAYGKCEGTVTGTGRMAHGHNYDPPRKYDAQALAKKKALADWSAKVKSGCPGYSHLWFRASQKRIACDAYAGGIGCEATAHPHKRRLY